ncbi:hypothetical protein BGZ96_001078 [Linnemannia gamsii]|uniref:Uncharacterized protein n=1 Tax=Linnemannia gamsii TaxID=64522 RepID=A0ABQ7K9F4_9FUNG|nr:hypothetical protein BGZ96_001078 [Linnemannia gamsii]
MKDGSGLKDRVLKEKIEEENLVVMGCMKGTFVLKKGGLVKKTICVKGINLVPPEELKRRLEGSSPALGMLRKGGRARRGGINRGGADRRNHLPGFSVRGTQHLVCYEMPSEMDKLHGPREYLELRDLPISKTFVMMQSYRVPLQILPLDFGQQPLDPADEYIHSNRVVESRTTRQSTPSPFNTTNETPGNKRPRTRGSRQRKRVEEEETSESEGGPDSPVDNTCGSSSGGVYYDSRMRTASQSFLPPLPAITPTPLPSTPAPLYHSYSTRGRDRKIREQIHQQQQLASWTPSPSDESMTVKDKKRKMPLSRSLAMETEHSSAAKVENTSSSMGYSYLAGRSTENGAFFQQHGMGAEGEDMGGDQHGPTPGMSTSTLTTRGTPTQIQDFLQAINSTPLQDDIELKVHGYSTVEDEGCLGTSSMGTTIGSVTNDALAHARRASGYNGGYDQPMSAYPYQDGSSWQQDPVYSRHQQQQQSPWDHEAYSQMNARKTYSGLYPVQQYTLSHYESQPQFQTTGDSRCHTPQQQTFTNDSITYYDTAQASTATLPHMHDFQGSYGYHTGEYGHSFPIESTMHSATMSDVSHNEGDLERSEEAGYSLAHQSTPRPERGDSPWSSGSAYTRSSSLSTSLTLSPVVRSEASDGHDFGPTAELKSGYQPWADAGNTGKRRDVGGTCWSTNSQLPYGDTPSINQQAVGEQERDSTTTDSCNYQGHTVSVSFVHNARSSTSHLATSQATSQVSADIAMLTPSPGIGHRDNSSASTASSMHRANYGRQDHQELSSPCQENPQLKAHSFQTSPHPFRRTSQQPYIPVMSFSSGTILGTSPVDSCQGSPTTPREEIMDSAVSGSEPQDSPAFPEDEAEELSNRGQEEVATDEYEDEDEVGSFMTQMQASSSLETPAHTPSEGLFTGVATISATMAVSPVQRSYYSAAAGASGAATTKSPTLSRQRDIRTYSSEPDPYSPQLRREYRHPPSFLFHDLDDRNEFDRMLEYHSHQVELLEEHDQWEEGAVMGGHEQYGSGRLRDTGEYGDHEVSGQTFQLTTPQSKSQSSGKPQMMSPKALLALHHYSNEGLLERDGIGGASTGSVQPAAPSLGMTSSSDSLGQDEYLLHQARPLITKRHVRRYGHGTGSGFGVGIGGTQGILGFGSSEGDGYMPGSGDSSNNEGLRSSESGSGAGAGQSEDLPWALSRYDDTTSSEIACQLFSGLDAHRGGGAGGERRVNASGMGVGIGTSIGDHSRGNAIQLYGDSGQGSGGSEGEVLRGGSRSVQTLQLSDPVDQYSFEESSSLPSSPLGAQEEYEDQDEEEKEEAEYGPHHHQ